jgi:hypothetical protein
MTAASSSCCYPESQASASSADQQRQRRQRRRLQIATTINDTDGKFSNGVNDTGGNNWSNIRLLTT